MEQTRENVARRPSRGFTLIEQIATLVVAITLACIAAPALSRLGNRSRLQAAQMELFSSLNHARGLAVTSGRRTLLCPSREGQRCDDGLHWEGGWLVGHYRSNQAEQLDGAPRLVAHGDSHLTILSTAGRIRVRFQSDCTAGGNNVTFTLCVRGQAEGALTVVASNAGRVYGGKASTDQGKLCATSG
jgi:type IV fimbrial biogenesis protein FimT